MNILHINTLQTAGAALCAMRINNALIKGGVASRMLFLQGESMPEGIEGAIAEEDKGFWYSNSLLRKIKYLLVRTPLWHTMDKEKVEMILRQKNRCLNRKLYLHGPYSSYKNIAHHPLVEWADVIHLHWVAYFIDYPTFFKEVKKPIVWTLHDKFPAVGIQHNCSEFYTLPNSLKDIDAFCRKVKRVSLLQAQSLNIVAISKMMMNICKESDVLRDFPVTLIHNGVDTNVFHPYDKKESRMELGLNVEATIFLFSSNSLDDPNKGLDHAIEALDKIKLPNCILVCIGIPIFKKTLPKVSFPIILAGYVSDQAKIAKYYSASDFFLNISYEETFAQAPIEAMACGTPVIYTPCSGADDTIRSFNGVLCQDFSVDALKDAIRIALTMHFDRDGIRKDICERFDYSVIGKQYIELYKSVLGN